MVIDSSALVAILTSEPDADRLMQQAIAAPLCLIGTATYLETCMVMIGRSGPDARLQVDPSRRRSTRNWCRLPRLSRIVRSTLSCATARGGSAVPASISAIVAAAPLRPRQASRCSSRAAISPVPTSLLHNTADGRRYQAAQCHHAEKKAAGLGIR